MYHLTTSALKKKKKSESSFYQSIAVGKGPEKESIRYILLIGLWSWSESGDKEMRLQHIVEGL